MSILATCANAAYTSPTLLYSGTVNICSGIKKSEDEKESKYAHENDSVEIKIFKNMENIQGFSFFIKLVVLYYITKLLFGLWSSTMQAVLQLQLYPSYLQEMGKPRPITDSQELLKIANKNLNIIK